MLNTLSKIFKDRKKSNSQGRFMRTKKTADQKEAFRYRDCESKLFITKHEVRTIFRHFSGAPLYIYDKAAIEESIEKLKKAFLDSQTTIRYAMKGTHS